MASGHTTPMDLGSDSVNGSSAAQNSSNSSKKVGEAPMQMIHKPSGYKYEREEDAPGYSWKSKRAFDEIQRSWDSVVQRDTYIGDKYGDPALVAPANTPWDKIV